MPLIERLLATYANGRVRQAYWLLQTLLTLYFRVTWSVWWFSRAIICITRSVAKHLEMINCFLWIRKYSAWLGSNVLFLQCTAEGILFHFQHVEKKSIVRKNISGFENGWQMDLIIFTQRKLHCVWNYVVFCFSVNFSETENYSSHSKHVLFHIPFLWRCSDMEGEAGKD